MRNRILAILLVAGSIVSSSAHALGLGDIEIYSALNQPLVAEIVLNSVRPSETDNIRVKLAAEDAFIQAGVDRPFYLTKLQFELATKPDGAQYIKVSTKNPIREPFLNFLVDVDWPRGRLIREYTVLLDPPVFAGAQESSASTEMAATSAPGASVAGSPGLIERDREATTTEDDFGFDDSTSDSAADSDGFDQSSTEEASDFDEPASTTELESTTNEDDDFGFAETEGTQNLYADLPDIEVPAAERTEDTGYEDEFAAEDGSADFADDSYTETGDEQVYSEPDDEFESTEQAPADEEYFDDSELPADEDRATEQGTAAFSEATIDTELPDITLFYDASLPYDENATNALLAQFAAEDEARGLREPATGADDHLVQAGDTLYDVANRYKAPDVSVNQAMLSILRYNPDAFIQDNINSVKKGFVLRIPDKESMLQIDSAEAMAEVRQQYALWREYRDQLAGAPSTARDAQAADDLYISERGSDTSTERRSELSILSPGRDAEGSGRASGAQAGQAGQAGSDEGSSLYVDLQLAREQLQAERLEKEELQARLTDLTAQIATQDRMISVQSEQLAQLQQRLAALGESDTEPPQLAATEETTGLSVDGEEGTDVAGEVADIDTGLTLDADGDLSLENLAAGSEADSSESIPESDSAAIASTEEPLTLDDSADTTAGFETDFEPQLALEDPLSLQAEGDDIAGDAQPETIDAEQDVAAVDASQEAATTEVDDAIEEPAVADEPLVSERRRPEGLAAYAYEYLPADYNINSIAADFLETPYGKPALGGILAFIILILFLALKPKKKVSKPLSVISAVHSNDESLDEDDGIATVEPAAPSFGERLSAMFAPITGIFGVSKKTQISHIAAAAAASVKKDKLPPKDPTVLPEEDLDSEAVIEDLGEIESFEETAKAAAAEAASETSEFTATAKSITTPGAVTGANEVVQEELSDDTTQEADVYLAYGLHDQAEELLVQALEGNPGKVEYQGKLLETYFAAGKKTEFESLAAELHSGLRGRSSRVWDKAIAMGKEIAPDNDLFTDVTDTGLKVSDFAPAKPETADLDLSEPHGSTTPDISLDEEGGASTTTDFDLDLSEGEEDDFDSTVLVSPGDRTEVMSAVDLDEDEPVERHDTDLRFDLDADVDEVASELNIDFNADELGLDTELDTDLEPSSVGFDENESETHIKDDNATSALDMSFNLDDESVDEENAIEIDMGDSDDIGLDDIGNIDEDVFEADASAGDDLIADLEIGGDDLKAASVDTEFEIPEDDDDTIIDADLDDETISGDIGDEVSTKLDLAKAYMDMGDYDGASSTLEEVMAEGDDSQRKEAEELLEQIH